MTPARLVPDRPLPPYTFVPGRTPHPVSDPSGHSFGAPPVTAPELHPGRWRTNTTYLYGLDLFNAGFFWESHVEFESLWLGAGRHGALADFLKALIHLAAAGVKHLEGRPEGVRSHARRAAELWRASPPDTSLGLGLDDLIALAEAVREGGWPSAPPVLLLPER